eukprot:768504-Hanusia_phi.AAC.2
MIPPNKSLVKYDNPVLLANAGKMKTSQPKSEAAGSALKNEKSTPLYQPEEILNSIIPPRSYIVAILLFLAEFEPCDADNGTKAVRTCLITNCNNERREKPEYAQCERSCTKRPSTRLSERFLVERACCSVVTGCKVTVNCAERGLLLIRVRDEIQMTRAAYQTLYESRCEMFGVDALCVDLTWQHRFRHSQGLASKAEQEWDEENHRAARGKQRESTRRHQHVEGASFYRSAITTNFYGATAAKSGIHRKEFEQTTRGTQPSCEPELTFAAARESETSRRSRSPQVGIFRSQETARDTNRSGTSVCIC